MFGFHFLDKSESTCVDYYITVTNLRLGQVLAEI